MSSINFDFLWLNDYEEFELCFRKDTFSVADCLCQAHEGRQNIFFKTEEQNNLQCCNCMKCINCLTAGTVYLESCGLVAHENTSITTCLNSAVKGVPELHGERSRNTTNFL